MTVLYINQSLSPRDDVCVAMALRQLPPRCCPCDRKICPFQNLEGQDADVGFGSISSGVKPRLAGRKPCHEGGTHANSSSQGQMRAYSSKCDVILRGRTLFLLSTRSHLLCPVEKGGIHVPNDARWVAPGPLRRKPLTTAHK